MLAVFALAGATTSAPAQTAASGVQTPAQTSPPQPDYHPSLGDLMTMAVQPRHLKLAIAGREKNWAYARYELSELRNAFGRVARTIAYAKLTNACNACHLSQDHAMVVIRVPDASMFPDQEFRPAH